MSWGEKNVTKEKLAERNETIVKCYYSGQTIRELSEIYCLSGKRIQGIIHEFALHDEKSFEKGIGQYLSIVGLVIRKV